MPSEDERPNFWTTFPGILTAVAGLVTAVTGLLIALNQVGVFDPSEPKEGQASAVTESSDPTGESGLPDPFESNAMYDMAHGLFDPSNCLPVDSPDAAPLAWNLDPRPAELVRCESPTGTYDAVFMCSDLGGLADIRDAYRANAMADTEEPILEPPADWAEPSDGLQISFEHVNGGDARVYWDSPVRGCAAELQSATASVDDTVAFWVNGP